MTIIRTERHIGQRFGKLIVLSISHRDKEGHAIVRCKCDCGSTKNIAAYSLLRAYTKSCGCTPSPGNTKHGKSKLPEYTIWKTMRQRCCQKSNSAYRYYGARGIRVCKRWNSFHSFMSDMGSRPDGAFIDRKDNNGNYEPSNCRWVTPIASGRNKRNSIKVALNGETKHWKDWCDELHISYDWVKSCLNEGQSYEAIFAAVERRGK